MKHTLLKSITLALILMFSIGNAMAVDYYYRGNQNSWGATKMTVSTDGYYAYYQAKSYSANGNQNNNFKISTSTSTWDYNVNQVSAGFNGTNITDMATSSNHWDSDNCGIYSTSTHYVLVYFPNTLINTTSSPVICAATGLPDNSAIYLKGNIGGDDNNWSSSAYAFSGSGTSVTLDISLSKNDYGNQYNMGFKLYVGKNNYCNDHWISFDGTLTNGNSTNKRMAESVSNNTYLIVDVSGIYTFTFNKTTSQLSVTYPEVYSIAGDFNSWDNSADELTGTNPKTVTITLAAETLYEFKVVDAGTWCGKTPYTYVEQNSNSVTGLTTAGYNMALATTYAGSYSFSYNTSTKAVTVTYPQQVPAMGGTLSLGLNTAYTDSSDPIISGSGTEADPYLVYQGKKLYVLATSSVANDAHMYYAFYYNNTTSPQQTLVSTTANNGAKKYNITVEGNYNDVKYIEVRTYYEYGPTGHKTQGTAKTARIYYKVMQPPIVTLADLDDVEKVATTSYVFLTASVDGHGIGASLGASPYRFMVKKPGASSFSNVLTSGNSTSSPYKYTLSTVGAYSFYVYVYKDGYMWYSDTITMKYYLPITVTVKTPSSVWTNVMFHTWDLGFGEDAADIQTTWLSDVTEGGAEYKYFSYTIKTTGTANFLMYNGSFDGGNQTADISITTDKCYEILNSLSSGKRAYKEMDACAAFYRVKSEANGKTFYSNVSSQDGDILSYFASSTGTLTLQKLTAGWTDVRTLSSPAASNVYVATVDADNDNVTDIAVYTGNYYLHSNISEGQNPGWIHYQNMTEAQRDSALFTYFEPNENYPDELYNYYWVRYVNTDVNVNAQVGNEYNMYLAEEIGAWPPYTDAETGKPVKAANIRFGYNPTTNWFGRNFIAGSSASATDFVTAYAECGMYEYDDGAAGDIIDSLNYQKFIDLSNWMYQLDVMAVKTSECYPQVIVRSGYGVETPLFGEGVTQNILGSGTTNGNYHMRLTYDYKTNRIISGWIPDDEDVGEITLEGNLIIQRTMNGDASHVVVSNGKEVLEVKQIYTVLTFDRDSAWTPNGPDNYGYYYYWISLPYDCYVGDIFGIPGYGTAWTMQRYRGDLRARDGWFVETPTFWHDMRTTNIMKAGQGYVIRIKKSAISFKEIDGRSTVRLFFPSMFEYNYTIAPTAVKTQVVPTYLCTIERDDRTKEDSNWNVLGVPGFSDNTIASYTAQDDEHSKEAAPKYFYRWAWNSSSKEGQYTAAAITGTTFRNTHAYMLQFGGTITWNSTYSSANAIVLDAYLAPQRREVAEDAEADNRMLALTLTDNNGQQDVTFVDMYDGATAAYDLNQDLGKILASSSLQVYTLGDERDAVDANGNTERVISRFAGNNLPLEATVVPVGVRIPSDGDYIFSANRDELRGLQPILYDAAEDRIINLLFDDYTVSLTKGTDENRFSLQLSLQQTDTATALDDTTNGYSVSQVNGGFVINGIGQTAWVELYDALGRRLMQRPVSAGERIEVPQTGVYVLSVNNTPLRVVLR